MRGNMKKGLSVLLCLLMLVQYIPTTAFAAGEDNLCEHHATHTAECGYAEVVAGSDCAHSHDDTCGYKEAVAEVKCACEVTDENGALAHTEGCGYIAPVTGADCTHVHDDACGYAAPVEAKPCTYHCDICLGHDHDEEEQETTAPSSEATEPSSKATEPDPVCNCGTDDEAYHATNCPVYVAPENPECKCAILCGSENLNLWCDVCGIQGEGACEADHDEGAAPYASGACGDNATWTFDPDTGTFTVSGSGAMTDYAGAANVPWKDYYSSITSIVIESGITTVGSCCFISCENLSSVILPDGLTAIGKYAFRYSGLTTVTIPASVTTIGDYAFDRNKLTSVSFGENSQLTTIGNLAFYNNPFTEIQLPAGVTSIGLEAFSNCSSLTSIAIPDGVTSIGNSAFTGCTALTSVTIPDSVTSIEENAFASCSSLTNITIPDSVTGIGSSAFHYCTGLTDITIPDSVTSIGSYAFYGCTSLTTVNVPCSWDENPLYTFDEGVIVNMVHNWTNDTCTVCGDPCDHTGSQHTTFTNNDDGAHSFTCTVCGSTGTEAHTFDATTGVCVCGYVCSHSSVDQDGCGICQKPAVVFVANEEGASSYYCDLATALSYGDAVASLLVDFTLTGDLTIPANMILDTNGHTLTVPEGMTLTNNGGLVFGDITQYSGEKGTYAENDTATVKIGTRDGILFENKLYYLGALCADGYIGINLNTATPNTYYPAGDDGYAIYEGDGTLRLHNAVITTPDAVNTDHTACIYSSGNLIIYFSGNNQLKSGNTADVTPVFLWRVI